MKSGIDFPNKKQLWLAVIILALVIFYLVKCRKTPQLIITTPTKTLIDTVRLIEKERQFLKDSFELVLRKHYERDYQDSSYLIQLLNQNSELSAINYNLQQATYPDTCEKIVSLWKNQYNTYVSQTNTTLDQVRKTTSGLSATVQTQKNYLAQKDMEYARLKRVTDTCLDNGLKMERYIKDIKPKRELLLSVSTIIDYVDGVKPAAGIGLAYRNKRGLQIEASYYTNQMVQIGIKKPLFRF